MKTHPKVKIELTIADKLLLILAWFSLAYCWNYFLQTYSGLQETIPVHFDHTGQIDSYGNKSSYIYLIIVPTIIFLGLSFLARIPHKLNYPVVITEQNAYRHYHNAFRILTSMQLVTMIIFFYLMWNTNMISNGTSTALNPFVIGSFILLLILPVTIYLIRAIRKK